MTRQIHVGGIPIGGGAPVTIQSMTNTRTDDVESTLSQIRSLAAAGCQIVRVAVPDGAAARAVAKIKEASPLPVVVDIHFDYKLALEAIAAGADKVRINPGNIGGEDRVKAVADACRLRGIPIRIGVNGGSLEKGLLAKYGGVCPEAMVESAFGHIRLLNKFDFDDICVSLKSSGVPMTMRAYQLMREKSNYPLHIGVTEAGTVRMGTLKSAVGIGGLLALGIGDTVGHIGVHHPQALDLGEALALQTFVESGPALVGVDGQAVILANGDVEGAAQLVPELGGDKQTALGVNVVRILTVHACFPSPRRCFVGKPWVIATQSWVLPPFCPTSKSKKRHHQICVFII